MNLPVPIGMIHPPHSEREVTNRWDQNERTCQAQRESSYQNQNEHKVWTMREGVGDRRRKIAGVPQYRSLSAPLNNNQTIGIQAIHEYKTVVLPKCTQKGARAMYWRRLALQIPCSSRMQTSGRVARGRQSRYTSVQHGATPRQGVHGAAAGWTSTTRVSPDFDRYNARPRGVALRLVGDLSLSGAVTSLVFWKYTTASSATSR